MAPRRRHARPLDARDGWPANARPSGREPPSTRDHPVEPLAQGSAAHHRGPAPRRRRLHRQTALFAVRLRRAEPGSAREDPPGERRRAGRGLPPRQGPAGSCPGRAAGAADRGPVPSGGSGTHAPDRRLDRWAAGHPAHLGRSTPACPCPWWSSSTCRAASRWPSHSASTPIWRCRCARRRMARACCRRRSTSRRPA